MHERIFKTDFVLEQKLPSLGLLIVGSDDVFQVKKALLFHWSYNTDFIDQELFCHSIEK
jgi:hypothetical protein